MQQWCPYQHSHQKNRRQQEVCSYLDVIKQLLVIWIWDLKLITCRVVQNPAVVGCWKIPDPEGLR